MTKALHQQLGDWGEETACQYLEKKGYEILDRNFRRKWGEIDIVCLSPSIVPRGTFSGKKPSVEEKNTQIVPRGTSQQSSMQAFWTKIKSFFKPKNARPAGGRGTILRNIDRKIVFIEVKTMQSEMLRPEEQVTYQKQKRLIRSCQFYLSHKKWPINTDWQIDVLSILLDKKTGRAKVEHIEQAVYFT